MNPQRHSVSLKEKKCEENYAKAREPNTQNQGRRDLEWGRATQRVGV